MVAGNHHHPNAINTLAITVSIIKRDENREAYLKCGFQLAGHCRPEQMRIGTASGPCNGPVFASLANNPKSVPRGSDAA